MLPRGTDMSKLFAMSEGKAHEKTLVMFTHMRDTFLVTATSSPWTLRGMNLLMQKHPKAPNEG
eukprot:5117557-Alexandrium_andersonii.AAC.1